MTPNVWKDCAMWLTNCGVLRPDHKTHSPDASLSDLAYTLRDGVLLCNLLNNLENGCLDFKDVNQKPQMAQFLCLRNIKTFLQACQDSFGLKESDLFEPSMLFELTDFFRVLCTLSKLSNCPIVLKKNIPGFSIHKPSTLSQEDIYRNLNASGDTPSPKVRTPHGDHVEYAHYDTHIHNEEIYQDLCSIEKKSSLPYQMPAASHSLEKRDYVINELVETEKNYVEVLTTLQRHFMRPLQSVIKDQDFKTIFSGIKELCEIHSGFHAQLCKVVGPNEGRFRLSEAFLNWREKFLIYGDYCANLTNAQNRLQDLCAQNETVNQEVNKCQQEANNGKFKLRDILSVPMQRILKYDLLLQKLIDETQLNHEDYRGLERAKEAMLDVAHFTNEVKRDCDTLQIMKEIQESILDWDTVGNTELKDYGRLLIDGELRIKAHNDQKTRVRYVFIFDQVMLMCKARGDQYTYKESLLLFHYKVDDVPLPGEKRDSRGSYQWILVHKSESTAYTMYVRTEELKHTWVKAVKDALDNIEPFGCRNTDHKYVMYTFQKPTTCNHCSKYLKGRIYQGYRCDRCFIGCHKGCIPFSGRCGSKQPPEVPPRPPINSITTEPTLQLLQPIPPMPVDWSRTWPADHQVLSEYLWFVGEMGRDRATRLLDRQTDGTYLLRIRPQGPTHPNESVYALSLKTEDEVKHMKVFEQRDSEGTQHYYLSESRFFRSIVDLISCYEHSSLGENYAGLNVRLKWPFRRIVAIAEFDFIAQEPNQLPLKQGCQVVVLTKEGDNKGWWKGKIQDRVGFFPKNYVRKISDTFSMD